MSNLTLGSLFDGSGGFPLAGILAGIKPVWSSEIEPFPIRVTEKRLPYVKHYGDIRNLNGAELPPVDIITFGSPCQDMSVAGKRRGLNGNRSGLFFQAIRVIKEMRCKTNGKKPRYIVWENVPGAFSSNGGEDFRSVLEEVCRVADDKVSIPKSEKWRGAGEIVGDRYSAAWRVIDARHWGVPQRRKRIFLVADFASDSAGKILFESEGVSGYSGSRFRAWQRAAGAFKDNVGASGGAHEIIAENVPAAMVFENHAQDGRIRPVDETSPTVAAAYGTGGNNVPLVLECYDVRFTSEGTKNVRANVYQTYVSRTIDCGGNSPDRNQGGLAVVSYGIGREAFNQGKNAQYSISVEEETEPTIVAKGPGAVAAPLRSGEYNYIVRRLTPTECARLMGFPDFWCSGLESEKPSQDEVERWRGIFEEYRQSVFPDKKPKTENQIVKWLKKPHSDSAEYKLWGNGVALPCVYFVLAGIVWCNSNNNSSECLYSNGIDNNFEKS